jgi:hypothetical protein
MGEDVQPTKVSIEQLATIFFSATLLLSGVSSIFCPPPLAISLFILAAASLHVARRAAVPVHLRLAARTNQLGSYRK